MRTPPLPEKNKNKNKNWSHFVLLLSGNKVQNTLREQIKVSKMVLHQSYFLTLFYMVSAILFARISEGKVLFD
jgi:hypothetical protein